MKEPAFVEGLSGELSVNELLVVWACQYYDETRLLVTLRSAGLLPLAFVGEAICTVLTISESFQFRRGRYEPRSPDEKYR